MINDGIRCDRRQRACPLIRMRTSEEYMQDGKLLAIFRSCYRYSLTWIEHFSRVSS